MESSTKGLGLDSESELEIDEDALLEDFDLELDPEDQRLLLETDDGAAIPEEFTERARRVEARIRAVLSGQLGEFDCETRNVSRSGALLSTIDEVGELNSTVLLSFSNQQSGEEIRIQGRIVRYIQEQGTAVAIAVEFTAPEDQRQEIIDFFGREHHADQERQARATRGRVDEFGLKNLIMMLASFSRGGILRLFRNQEEAQIGIEPQGISFVQLGRASHIKALARLFHWHDAAFQFDSLLTDTTESEETSEVDGMLREAEQEANYLQQLDLADLPMDAEIIVDRQALEQIQESLSPAEQSVVELASVKLSIRRILDVIPEPDSAIYPTILGLKHRGVLRKV